MKKLAISQTFIILAIMLAISGVANIASAGVLFEHIGANDPEDEGWTANFASPTVIFGPVINDPGFGLDAWFVDDNGVNIGDAGLYSGIPTPAEILQGETFGWTLSARLRIVDFPDPAPGTPTIGFDASPFIAYRNGMTTYQIHFGAQADGDPIVYLPTAFAPAPAGTEIILDGFGSGYHLYELVFDPAEGDIDLFINGIEMYNGFAGSPLVQSFVLFGAGSSCCLGQGNYNMVRFEVVPALVLSGAEFEPPVYPGPITVNKNRVIPFKVELRDTAGNLITDQDIVAPPVIQVVFDDGMLPAEDVTDDALSAGKASEGNQFVFNDPKWQFNLKTKEYSAAGTYTVSIISGDDAEYEINPPVEGTFVILP